jgi:serine/threonine-protein kinase HipA
MATRSPLDVWLYGTLIARLKQVGDQLTLEWTPEAAQRWAINSTVLSVLLPITPHRPPHPARVRAFFAGLMPEGDARTHLAVDAGVEVDDVLGMMNAYGRDVAGALIIQPEGSGEPSVEGTLRPVSDVEIREKLLRADANTAPLGIVPGVTSLSLAGMQPKIALRRDDSGQWLECLDGAPSTHILKPGRPPGSPVADLIHNEAFSLELARHLGLTTVDAEVRLFAGLEALVVSRYDRATSKGIVGRRHQEDCAQMLGLNTDDPARKFQYGGALPSLRRIAAVLRTEYAPQRPLLQLTTLNVALGNTDAHAKNISVLHHENGALELAPAYDISPHRHYPNAGRRAAMDVNGLQDIDAITVDDLVAEAVDWELKDGAAREAVMSVLERTRTYVDSVPAIFSARSGVPDLVLETVLRRVARLLEGVSAGSA